MLRKTVAFVLFLLAGTLPAPGQRVGVVMSGGGAKGLFRRSRIVCRMIAASFVFLQPGDAHA
mgnify:CR=1 FL=1